MGAISCAVRHTCLKMSKFGGEMKFDAGNGEHLARNVMQVENERKGEIKMYIYENYCELVIDRQTYMYITSEEIVQFELIFSFQKNKL